MCSHSSTTVPRVKNFLSSVSFDEDGTLCTIQNMAHTDGRTGSWGTEAEILALTEILHRNIEVYNTTGEKFVKQTFCFSEDHTATLKQVIVLLNTNNHYELLDPTGKTGHTNTASNPPKMNHNDQTKQRQKRQQEGNNIQTTIFNFSVKVLKPPEKSLLEKGLKFIPTRQRVDIANVLADLRE